MQSRSRSLVILFVLLIANRIVAAEPKEAESKETKIKRALSAAPSNVAREAKVVDMDEKGNMTVLRVAIMVSPALLATSEWSQMAPPAWTPPCSGIWTGWRTSLSPPTRSPELFTNWMAIAIGVPLILGRPAELLISGRLDG